MLGLGVGLGLGLGLGLGSASGLGIVRGLGRGSGLGLVVRVRARSGRHRAQWLAHGAECEVELIRRVVEGRSPAIRHAQQRLHSGLGLGIALGLG